MNISVKTERVNEERHYAHLDQDQLTAIITEAVAKAAGVRLAQSGVKVTRCWIRTEHWDGRGTVAKAEVEIVVDRADQPAEGEGVSNP
jgi:hypothetical protein